MILVLLLIHALAAALAPLLVKALGRRAFWVMAIAPAATFGWALSQTAAAHSDAPPRIDLTWVPSLNMQFSFLLDPLSWLMTLVVGGVGALVLIYCAGYFADDEPGLGRFAGCLTAFAGAMLGLVATNDLLVLFLFWEATTVLSYLLIGHRPESRSARSAAMEALVVTTFGGLAMLVGIVLIGEAAGTYQIDAILADPPTGAIAAAGVTCLLLGALTKSAQLPFHFWLPGAMAAPTPVSAYLHAAAMVKAGVYLVLRFAPGFADSPFWHPVLWTVGGATMLLGAYRALRQYDLKLLLAYGTISQLGFLMVIAGSGTFNGGLSALTLLLAHALFKACLFLVVGTIDHSAHTRDIRELNGLARRAPGLLVVTLIALGSMAGLLPMLGFVSKELAYDTLWYHPDPAGRVMLAVIVLGSVLTFAYSARFAWGAFGPDSPQYRRIREQAGRGERTDQRVQAEWHAPGPLLVGVPLLLAVISLVAGPLSTWLEPLLEPYAALMPAEDHAVHLGLWHGITPALVLTGITIALGVLLFLARRPVETFQAAVSAMPSAESGYRFMMRALDRVSLEVTGALQRGSLPLSLGLILGTFTVLTVTALVLGRPELPATVAGFTRPVDIGIALLGAAAAILAVRSRRRFRGVFLVGVTGYCCALLFLLHGAPDLALTQILVETVSLVVFVLVLRRFSGRFNDDSTRRERTIRTVLGVAVGLTTAAVGVVAVAARNAPPASTGMDRSAYEFGGGTNIVNVILVDIRAWDTMGELSVVLVAATGIASLVYLRGSGMRGINERLREARSRRRLHTRPPVSTADSWLAEGAQVPTERRSVIFEVVTRLVFHTIILWSIYLLLSGHYLPGGGFAAGLVAGLALTVRYLAGGRAELQAAAPVTPGLLMGTGLFLSAGFGFASELVGGTVLQSWKFSWDLPILGHQSFVTSTIFDIGVYLVVIGLMLDILRSLGGRIDAQIESEAIRREDEANGSNGSIEGVAR